MSFSIHAKTKTNGSGHLYQGRYKSFLVDTDQYLLCVIKYVEYNPVRAQLTKQPQDWRWGSAWRRVYGSTTQKQLVDDPPTPFPHDYLSWIAESEKSDDVSRIRISVNKGMPYGRETWVEQMVTAHNLISTVRAPGRPKKLEHTL